MFEAVDQFSSAALTRKVVLPGTQALVAASCGSGRGCTICQKDPAPRAVACHYRPLQAACVSVPA